MSEIMTQTKVAMIRRVEDEHAKLILNCKCGNESLTDIVSKNDVVCTCGKVYTYNGWVK